MENDNCIAITHFINPHLFWYKIIEAPGEQFHVLNAFEQTLLELYKNKALCDNLLRPQIGDKVAVNFIAWNKYIRGKVLQKEFQQEEYIVWALDYGFPLLTKKEYLRNLPANLQADIGYVRVGGITNILPAEQEYDDVEGNLVMVKKDKWLQKTCDMLEKLLSDANSISFTTHFQQEDGHVWGDLSVINHKGIQINARKYLLNTMNAVEEVDLIFKKKCSKFESIKIAPWLSNNRNIKMKFNNIKHNYIEHSLKMSAIEIDEKAKRKVEDWQERNERKKNEAAIDALESSCELSEDNIDDITFDDSASVTDNHNLNFIGKAGFLTKIKQQKYSSDRDLPPFPPELSKFSEISQIIADADLATKQMSQLHINDDAAKWNSRHPIDIESDISIISRDTSAKLLKQNLLEMRKKIARAGKEKLNNSMTGKAMFNQNETNAASQSKTCDSYHYQLLQQSLSTLHNATNDNKQDNESESSTRNIRIKQLLEKRKKISSSNFEKSNDCTEINNTSEFLTKSNQHKFNQNETNSTCQSKACDSYPYHLLQQSLSTLHNSTNDNKQDNESESSARNIRIKQLMEKRKKISSSNLASCNDGAQSASQFLKNNNQDKTGQQQSDDTDRDMKSVNNFNFEHKPKITSKQDDTTEPLSQMNSFKLASKNNLKESLKLSQAAGYDRFTLVPGGFDITRLQTYNNEVNHWHRKKSTLADNVPHDQTSSTDELLSNKSNDQSFSSSDFTVASSLKGQSQNSKKQLNCIDSTHNVSHNANIGASIKEFDVKKSGGSNLSSGHSINSSSNSSQLTQKGRKRKQLKSPASQLSKINQILLEHGIEKEMGNENILDLQLLNTSSVSQKSLLSNTPLNVSSSNKIVPSLQENNNIKNRSSRSSTSIESIRNEKVYKDVSNYEVLMDVKRTEYLPAVEGECKIQTKFIDHLVLAHSSIQLMPIENISEAPFLPEIHEELRQMRVNKVYRIQVYSWSHVLRNNSLFVVNPSRSGKTWSYLPPLCSLLCCRKDGFKPSYGPAAIILVASLKHVELVTNHCRRLMNGFKAEAPTCVPSYGMRNLVETKVRLLNGCEILIATPSNILRLLHENETEPLFDAERLQHIVIDDMDIMMSRSQHDFEKAYTILFKMVRKSNHMKLSPQLIVTSRDWDGLMVKFIRKSNQPLLLIGDFLEAAVYGRASLTVKLKSYAEKNNSILKFIKNMSECASGMDNRTIIICNEDEDVQNIYTFLQDCGYPSLVYYNRSTEIERAAVDEWKKQVSSKILISTDARFKELKVQNVNNLIHYSMPTSWTQFTLRFSALARTYNNYISHFENNILCTPSIIAKKNNAHSMILLDENNNLQLPRLVNFMRKHNQLVQDEIQAVSRRIVEEHRILNNASLLCSQLLEFGECDEPRCDERHELTRLDVINKSDAIPCSGEIRIHVLKVFSPTYYAVRLLHHKPFNTVKWLEIRRSSEALSFSIQLNMYYSNSNNLVLHWPPHVNDLCIYQYAETFRRARILEAPTLQHNETNVVQANLRVNLRLIDDGNVIGSVKCNEIFVCGEQFKEFPPQAVDVRLMKVVPFDNERSWDSKTTKQVQKWIIEDIKTNYVVQASIDFSLANTIWVKNLVVMEKLTGIDAYCQVVNLKKSLITKNFGVLYNGDRKHVRDLAEEFNLLNSLECDANTTVDSDIDYQSCRNESINLITFSSSNDETVNSSMESSETDSKQVKVVQNKTNDVDGAEKKMRSEGAESEMDTHEENWDTGEQFDEVYDPFRLGTVDKDRMTKEESWSQLPLNELVKVEIGDEGENGNWENIFLQIIDSNSMFLFEDLTKLIVDHVENLKSKKEVLKQIYDFEPLHNCIVKYNNVYLRAKVYGVYGENLQERLYRFFLCDYACFTNAKIEELYNDFLYETTEDIITFTPYQAVHCTLAGIKWDSFTKRYQVTKDFLYACAVLESDSKQNISSELQNLSINSYKILLYECENENEFSNALLFNKALVDNGITVHDADTKSFLEYEIGVKQKEDHMPRNEENNKVEDLVPVSKTDKDAAMTYEQLLDFIKSDAFDIELDDILTDVKKADKKNLKCNAIEVKSAEKGLETEKNIEGTKSSDGKILKDKTNIPNSDSEIDEQGHCTSTSNSNSSIKSSTSLISTETSNRSVVESPPPLLKALHKRPLTTWYQNDFMIFLSIHAPDVKAYLLEVSIKTILFVADIQSEKCVLILNLLGSVDSKSVSHEIRGLNVVIRLKKLVFMEWPRLVQQSAKYCWLKYNFNTFDSIEMEYLMPHQVLHTMLDNKQRFYGQHNDDVYNSEEDNERELYQTYNTIQNNDDCDPFSAF